MALTTAERGVVVPASMRARSSLAMLEEAERMLGEADLHGLARVAHDAVLKTRRLLTRLALAEGGR